MADEELAAHQVLGAMAVLSEELTAGTVASSCLELAEIIAAAQGELDDETAARLLELGGALWAKAVALGEDVGEFTALYRRKH